MAKTKQEVIDFYRLTGMTIAAANFVGRKLITVSRWERGGEVRAEYTCNRSSDTPVNVAEVQRFLGEYPYLRSENAIIDNIGIDRDVTDRLKELSLAVNVVSTGSPAEDSSRFANIKAENY